MYNGSPPSYSIGLWSKNCSIIRIWFTEFFGAYWFLLNLSVSRVKKFKQFSSKNSKSSQVQSTFKNNRCQSKCSFKNMSKWSHWFHSSWMSAEASNLSPKINWAAGSTSGPSGESSPDDGSDTWSVDWSDEDIWTLFSWTVIRLIALVNNHSLY